ncbi:MAG TPA: hypothetical protein VJJ23_03990 [Candidatus Nanoarchaeia archaeon]|nr:hypothetical protein [Candidatus Nanoarchaeia archaeon]
MKYHMDDVGEISHVCTPVVREDIYKSYYLEDKANLIERLYNKTSKLLEKELHEKKRAQSDHSGVFFSDFFGIVYLSLRKSSIKDYKRLELSFDYQSGRMADPEECIEGIEKIIEKIEKKGIHFLEDKL